MTKKDAKCDVRPREFWITLHRNQFDVVVPLHAFGSRDAARFESCLELVHVREVVPIDWEKVWKAYETHYIISFLKDGAKQTIQQLVEKQLAGES